MIINIEYAGNKYSIEGDRSQYTLVKHGFNIQPKSKNFGKPTRADLGYFTKVGTACTKILLDVDGNDTEEMGMKAYIERLEHFYNSISDQIKKA